MLSKWRFTNFYQICERRGCTRLICFNLKYWAKRLE